MEGNAQMIPPNINIALTFAHFGVSVFPCREAGIRAKSPYVAKGFHQATADRATLIHWATQYPNALQGLPCAANGLFVLDADRHGNGDGIAIVMALFAQCRFDWRTVPSVRTPSDGMHFLFQRPAGLGKTKAQIAPAVDVRDNGYIIAPGTVLPDGRQYLLTSGTIPQLALAIAGRTLPMMPKWLIEMAVQPYREATSSPMPLNSTAEINGLEGLVRAIVSAKAGNRNRILYWASCRLGVAVSKGSINSNAALALLLEAGQQAGLGYSETYSTAQSGLRKGQQDASYG